MMAALMKAALMKTRARRFAVPAVLAVTLCAHPAAAQTGPVSDFLPSGEYALEVAGKPVPKAEIYQSVYASAILVLSSELPAPVRLNPRAQSVETVNLMKISKQGDGSITLLPDSTLQPQGAFTFADEDVLFAVDGKACKLKSKPALVGLHPAAELKAYKPEYLRNEARYTADSGLLQTLKKGAPAARVRIFFGSWCPHCTANMPSMFKVEEGVQGSAIQFEYYGLPRPPAMGNDPEAKKAGVNAVPTGIVYDAAGKELGRISGDDWRRPEGRLVALLVPGAPKS